MFAALKKMDPQSREKALVQILKTYEERKKAAGGAKTQPQARPQGGKLQPQAKPQQAKAPQPKPQQPKKPEVSGKDPDNLKFGRSKQEMKQPSVKRKPETQISEDDFISSGSTKKNDKGTTKKDIVVVLVILAVFVALCLGLKLIINHKVGEVEEMLATSTPPTTRETTVTTTTEPPVPTETEPSPTPEPTHVPLAEDAPDLTGMVIVIDPGHQAFTSEGSESVSSDSGTEKPRATSGSIGATGVCEYELTLQVSLELRDYLEQCGATVLLTREENEVDVSNQERAALAVDNNANLFLRIHADSANDSLQSGVKVFVPDSGDYTTSNAAWGESLGTKVAEALGLPLMDVTATSVYTGLNYANTVPSFQISLGLLSNSDDEAILLDEDNQIKACAAMASFAAELMPGESAENTVEE